MSFPWFLLCIIMRILPFSHIMRDFFLLYFFVVLRHTTNPSTDVLSETWYGTLKAPSLDKFFLRSVSPNFIFAGDGRTNPKAFLTKITVQEIWLEFPQSYTNWTIIFFVWKKKFVKQYSYFATSGSSFTSPTPAGPSAELTTALAASWLTLAAFLASSIWRMCSAWMAWARLIYTAK